MAATNVDMVSESGVSDPGTRVLGADDRVALMVECSAAAQEAADLLLALRRGGDVAVTDTKSSSTDVVTNADAAAERLLRQRLFQNRPGDAWLGEESGSAAAVPVSDHPGAGIRWIVDPLDGTVNYLYDLPGWAVSVAAEHQGQIIAGAVVVPSNGEVFCASLGQGAECNGRPVGVRACDDLASALVATGFSYDPEVRERQGHVLASVLPKVRDIRRFGAAAADLCALAAGRVDAYFEFGLQPWDRAAGVLMAREAGARVEVDAAGSVIAAAPGVHASLRDLLAHAGGDPAR